MFSLEPDLSVDSVSSAQSSSARTCNRRIKGVYYNRTQDRLISNPVRRRVSKSVKPSKPSEVIDRTGDFYSPLESDIREFLGKALYAERGELIRELSVVYSFPKSLLLVASVSSLRKWLADSRKLENLEVGVKFLQPTNIAD